MQIHWLPKQQRQGPSLPLCCCHYRGPMYPLWLPVKMDHTLATLCPVSFLSYTHRDYTHKYTPTCMHTHTHTRQTFHLISISLNISFLLCRGLMIYVNRAPVEGQVNHGCWWAKLLCLYMANAALAVSHGDNKGFISSNAAYSPEIMTAA